MKTLDKINVRVYNASIGKRLTIFKLAKIFKILGGFYENQNFLKSCICCSIC